MIAVSLVLTPITLLLFRYFATKLGLMDVPDSRKIHANPIPIVGGLSIFVVSVTLLLMLPEISVFHKYLISSAGILLVVGLLDDLYQLSALVRFIAQIIASLVVIYFAGISLNTFGRLLTPSWDMDLGILSVPISVFGVVGVINAINMSDGIDGLAAATFCAPVVALILLSGQSSFNMWLIVLVISVLIFIIFNKTKSYKVFLGDNGSLFLGFILAWLLVFYSQGGSQIIYPVTALYLVALPVFDTIFVMLRRLLVGNSPFKPDKSHLHHLFLSKGYSQTKTLGIIVFCQVVFIFLGIVLLKLRVPENYQFYGFVLFSLIYYKILQKLWGRQNE